MAQFGRPDSDITVGNWTPSTGTDLYATIDETTASDTDYIERNAVAYCEVGLSSVTDPSSSTGHVVRYRYGRSRTDRTLTLVVRLYQGSTEIASWTHTDPAISYSLAEQTLSTAQADAITDYADLRLRFDITAIQNTQVNGQVSWAELEVPDAPTGTTYNQSAAGSVTPTGAIVKTTQTAKAGSLTPTGALIRSVLKSLSGALGLSGALSAEKTAGAGASGTPIGLLLSLTYAGEPDYYTWDVSHTEAWTYQTLITLHSGSGTVDWGDGSTPSAIISGTPMNHEYAAGSYTVILVVDVALVHTLQIAATTRRVTRADDPVKLTALNAFQGYGDSGWSQNISSWSFPSTLEYLYLYNTSVSGDISGWTLPSSLLRLYIYNTSVSGDISGWTLPSSLQNTYLYSTSIYGTPDMSGATGLINYLAYDCGLSRANVDALLKEVYDNRSIFIFSTKRLYLAGTNGAPNGVYQYSATPSTGQEYRYILVNDPDTEGFNVWDIQVSAPPQSVAGTLGLSGVMVRKPEKVLSGSLTPAGTLVKNTLKSISGSLGLSGAIDKVKTFVRSFAGSLGLAGVLSRQSNKTLAGTLTPAGTLIKSTLKSLAGSLGLSGAVTTIKSFTQSVAGTLGLSGAITTAKTTAQAIAGTLGLSGTISRLTGKVVSGTLTPTGSLAKSTLKSFAGTLGLSGVAAGVKLVFLSIAGTLGLSGVITKQTSKSPAGSLGLSGVTIKQIAKAFTGALGLAGALGSVKAVFLSIAGTLGLSGVVSKQTGKAVSGIVTFAGIVTKQVAKTFSGVIGLAGDLSLATLYSLLVAGTLALAGTVSRQTNKVVLGVLGLSGGLSRLTSKVLSGVLTPAGALIKSTLKILSGSLVLSGIANGVKSAIVLAMGVFRTNNDDAVRRINK